MSEQDFALAEECQEQLVVSPVSPVMWQLTHERTAKLRPAGAVVTSTSHENPLHSLIVRVVAEAKVRHLLVCGLLLALGLGLTCRVTPQLSARLRVEGFEEEARCTLLQLTVKRDEKHGDVIIVLVASRN